MECEILGLQVLNLALCLSLSRFFISKRRKNEFSGICPVKFLHYFQKLLREVAALARVDRTFLRIYTKGWTFPSLYIIYDIHRLSPDGNTEKKSHDT